MHTLKSLDATAVVHQPPRDIIPPLESGDHLTRAEFERRYEAMPHLKKAELVEGKVTVASPVSALHSEPHATVMMWLGIFAAFTPQVEVHDNASLRLDPDNEVQPDALLALKPAYGGTMRRSEDGYLEGAPGLVVEVAVSSASHDLYDKRHVYRRNGVQEYVVWQVLDGRLNWWRLEAGQYVPLAVDEDGIVRSHLFPGLWLAGEALLTGDKAAVFKAVQAGVMSEAHRGFVARVDEQTANVARGEA